MEQERARGAEILDLTESNPTRAGLVFPEVADIIARHLRDSLLYEPSAKGLPAARKAVADYYSEHGAATDIERVFLTASTSEAYTYLFRLLCNSGDRVLVPKPSYPLFDFLAQLSDVEVDRYPLLYDGGWKLDREALAKAFTKTTRAVVVVRPNNPTGCYLADEELKFVEWQCAERGAALICDEVFLDYPLKGGEPRRSALSICDQALTFVLSGISKILALPQMKLGWIAVGGPEAVRREAEARLEIIADTFLSVNTPIQQALPELMQERERIAGAVLNRVRANLKTVEEAFDGLPGATLLSAEGGWYAVLELPNIRTDEEWALRFLNDAHVLVHPGYFYDFDTEGHMVLSLLPEPKVFADGVRRIKARL